MKLDLGCGKAKREGFVGVDISADCDADIVHDLSVTPWPFADASIDEVHCAHFFEHLDGAQRVRFMEELFRILKPGSLATLITPHWTSMGAVQDPTHKWPPIAENSYGYFNKAWRARAGVEHYDIHCDFDVTFTHRLDAEFAQLAPKEQRFAVHHYVNAVHELTALLRRR
jgi:predicted SAM-dependent methyltransferase